MSENFLEISRNFLDISKKCLEISTKFQDISTKFLAISTKFLEISRRTRPPGGVGGRRAGRPLGSEDCQVLECPALQETTVSRNFLTRPTD